MPVFDSFDSFDDLDDLAERCESPDPGIRRVAMMELAEATGPEATILLLKALGDSDATVRAAAAKALDEHDGTEVVEGLVRSLEDADAEVRRVAADTLAEKKELACGPLLIERAGHPDPFVQASALRALRELLLPDALAAALAGLASPSADVRREGVGVIGYLKADTALPALIATASDAEPAVRRATMSALVFVRPGSVGAGTLLRGLSDENWQVREEAAMSLAKSRLPEGEAPLIAAMDDPVWQVRTKAANALGRIKAKGAIPTLGAALDSDISNLRKESAAALGEIADPAALTWLEAVFDDPDPDVRKLVRWAIGRCQEAV